MKSTLTIPTAKLLQFQELVKAHNLRFDRQPLICPENTLVVVSSDHLPPGACRAFWEEWDRLNTPVREQTRAPRFMARVRRWLRKVRKQAS